MDDIDEEEERRDFVRRRRCCVPRSWSMMPRSCSVTCTGARDERFESVKPKTGEGSSLALLLLLYLVVPVLVSKLVPAIKAPKMGQLSV